MTQTILMLSVLVVSSTCTLYYPIPFPAYLATAQVPREHDPNPNYNFAYEVNDIHTGDVKSQSESKRGDIILGQYTLLQPDGVKRTVDYKADSLNGFTATVNNEGAPISRQTNKQADKSDDEINIDENESNRVPQESEAPNSATMLTPLPVSRSYILQTIPDHREQYITSINHYQH